MQNQKPASSGFSYHQKHSRRAAVKHAVRGFASSHIELVRRIIAASLVLAVFLPSFGVTLARYKSEETRKGVMLSSTAFFSSPQLARPNVTTDDS